MLASIQNWINDEKAAKNDPACSGNGIKLRVNNALLDAMVLYARDLSGMRVPARELGLRAKDWRQAPK
jgi:hypothetical protein